MTTLGVNIDHVASLRQIRRGQEPDILWAARLVESAGADSIVVHLREDRRHINDTDVARLKKALRLKLNLEMSCVSEIVDIACRLKPDQATLVPEKRREVTTEGGLDVACGLAKVKRTVKRLMNAGIEVSLFIDPEKKQIDAARDCGVRVVEFHTGRYADAPTKRQAALKLKELSRAASYARSLGFKVCAGHGLDYANVGAVGRLKAIEELNIGYAIICRAVLVGLKEAVREMRGCILNKK